MGPNLLLRFGELLVCSCKFEVALPQMLRADLSEHQPRLINFTHKTTPHTNSPNIKRTVHKKAPSLNKSPSCICPTSFGQMQIGHRPYVEYGCADWLEL